MVEVRVQRTRGVVCVGVVKLLHAYMTILGPPYWPPYWADGNE